MWHAGEKKIYIKVLAGKPEVKKSFERTRRRCKNKVKLDLTQISGRHGLDLSS